MIVQEMVTQLYDCQVIDPTGEKIGSVKRIWLDDRTGDPVWASVHTGMAGTRETFIPLQRAELRDDQLRVPIGKATVKDAPQIEAEGDRMSDEEQQRLYQYYQGSQPGATGNRPGMSDRQDTNLPGSVQRSPAGGGQGTGRPSDLDRFDAGQRAGMGKPGSGRRDDMARGAAGRGPGSEGMTRSAERKKIGTEDMETGRIRLVKHMVTDEQQASAPVSPEESRIGGEPKIRTEQMDIGDDPAKGRGRNQPPAR